MAIIGWPGWTSWPTSTDSAADDAGGRARVIVVRSRFTRA